MPQTLPKGCRLLKLGSPEHRAFVEDAEKRIASTISRSSTDFLNQQHGLFPVTPFLSIGREQDQNSVKSWYQQLHREGATDVIRLRREAFRKGLLGVLASYPSIHHLPMEPSFPLEMPVMRTVMLRLHHLLHHQEYPQILMHCMKGEDRSPTALWMYFVAIGLSEEMADRLIKGANYLARPAEKPMIWREDVGQMKRLRSIGQSLASVRSDLFDELYPFPWPRPSK